MKQAQTLEEKVGRQSSVCFLHFQQILPPSADVRDTVFSRRGDTGNASLPCQFTADPLRILRLAQLLTCVYHKLGRLLRLGVVIFRSTQ